MVNWILSLKSTVWYFMLWIFVSCNAEPGCPGDLPDTTLMTSYNGKCYQYVSDASTWTSARDYCLENGGSLVILNDEQTSQFVTETLSSITAWSNNGVWIGLNDRADDHYWQWVTADPDVFIDMTWSNWGGDHPKKGILSHLEGDCVRMKRSDGWKWHEASCYSFHRLYRFICEYEQDVVTTAPPETLRLAAIIGHEKEIYTTTNSQVVTTAKADSGEQAALDIAAQKELKTYLLYTIIAGLTLLVLLLIVLFGIHMIRRRSSKRRKRSPPSYEESLYEDITLPGPTTPLTKSDFTPTHSQTTSMQTSEIRENRLSNIYVEPDMQSSKVDAADDVTKETKHVIPQNFDSDGYMEPKKLMTQSQLSDTYLTVSPLTSPTGENPRPINSNEIEQRKVTETHDYANTNITAQRKLPSLPDDYLPMRGSREVLVCDENSKSVPSPTSSKEETIEQVYSEI